MSTAPIDIPVKVKGLSDLQKLERRMEALEREVTRLQKSASKTSKALPAVGQGARGAAAGVRAFAASIQTALGPLGAALAGVAGLSAAFETLSNQNFAEAKVRSLGVESEELVTRLQEVSRELRGAASVAELTASAYDVASAGFTDAADAANILKAASLGATGGFSDINTVADAATSVLNSYGASARDAGLLIDGFIQTQNDGKIVVAEYAKNIAKVASIAAGLKIPITEVNAAIAQSTAAGVQAEVAFTGLKSALARLASGEAAKALKGAGIEISAATVEADGLLGTLKKLQGLDTGSLLKALGTEAGPALLPVIQNLEKFEALIRNQENAAGAAAKAQQIAANTIQGAWARLQNAFKDIFSDQSELGAAIQLSLQAAAVTVEALGAAIKLLASPFRALLGFLQGFADAFSTAFGIEQVDLVEQLGKGWSEFLKGVDTAASTIAEVGRAFGEFVGQATAIFTDLFGGISQIVSGFGQELQVAFSRPVNAALDAWDQFTSTAKRLWDGFSSFVLDTWGVVSDFVGGVISNIQGWWEGLMTSATGQASAFGEFVSGVWAGIQSGVQSVVGAITGAFQKAFDAAGKIIVAWYNKLPAWLRGALETAASVASGVAGAVTNALKGIAGQVKTAVAGVQDLKLNLDLSVPQGTQGTGAAGGTSPAVGGVPTGGGGGGSDAAAKAALQAAKEEKKIQQESIALALKKTAALWEQFQALDDQKAILEAKLNGNEREVRLAIAIRDATAGLPPEVAKVVAERMRSIDALEQEVKKTEDLKNQTSELESAWQAIGGQLQSSVGSAIDGLIDGTADLNEMLQQTLKDMAKLLIKGALFGFGGGGGGLFGGLFAEGGTLGAGKWGIAGEAGPEIISGPARITPMSQMSDGGTSVSITVNATGGSETKSSGEKAKEGERLARLIESSVVGVLNREKRPGGILSK